MDTKEQVIIVLPGDKITLVANRPLRFYYRVEEIKDEDRIVNLVL